MKQPLWSHALDFVALVFLIPIVFMLGVAGFAFFLGFFVFPFLRWLGFPVY